MLLELRQLFQRLEQRIREASLHVQMLLLVSEDNTESRFCFCHASSRVLMNESLWDWEISLDLLCARFSRRTSCSDRLVCTSVYWSSVGIVAWICRRGFFAPCCWRRGGRTRGACDCSLQRSERNANKPFFGNYFIYRTVFSAIRFRSSVFNWKEGSSAMFLLAGAKNSSRQASVLNTDTVSDFNTDTVFWVDLGAAENTRSVIDNSDAGLTSLTCSIAISIIHSNLIGILAFCSGL